MHSYVRRLRASTGGSVPAGLPAPSWPTGTGNAVAYALFNLEPRGRLFVVPGEPVYEGMIVGEHNRDNGHQRQCLQGEEADQHAGVRIRTTMSSSTPIKPMTLEQAIDFIREDELVEVTPNSIRMRKAVLSAQKRHALRSPRVNNKKAA